MKSIVKRFKVWDEHQLELMKAWMKYAAEGRISNEYLSERVWGEVALVAKEVLEEKSL